MSDPSVRLLNSIWFVGKEMDGMQFVMGKSFAKEFIFEFLGVTTERIYCDRDFPVRNASRSPSQGVPVSGSLEQVPGTRTKHRFPTSTWSLCSQVG